VKLLNSKHLEIKQVVYTEELSSLQTVRQQVFQIEVAPLKYARQHNYEKIIINAQVYIEPLYQKLGFLGIGEPFDEAGIPHRKMIKYLDK
jgi:hypothetical protein